MSQGNGGRPVESDGEKSNSLHGDSVRSRHRPLDLQVPPAMDDKSTITSADPAPEEAPPTKPNPGGPAIGCVKSCGFWDFAASWGPHSWFQGSVPWSLPHGPSSGFLFS